MCTSVTWESEGRHFVGRNLDFEISYGQRPVATPRNYPFHFKNGLCIESHFAIIGMAAVAESYPLYFDATNEKGLSAEGLMFKTAKYSSARGEGCFASFELIPYLLGTCGSVKEAKGRLGEIRVTDEAFSPSYPPSPLHWMICDQKECITVEVEEGEVKVYDNPVGVLANCPSFDKQLFNLNNYPTLSPKDPEDSFAPSYALSSYSRAMGTHGLPGGLDSESRFVRGAFSKLNASKEKDEKRAVAQFFHILRSVYQIKGLDAVEHGFEYTIYTSCVDMDKAVYRYMVYEDFEIREADLHSCDLDGCKLTEF
ncbi:MAG: choloylglycine hydrolase [Aeriscardovia sp.]|nr:choloylglycine hydrolase [Aeriscardovia sp.]